MSIEPISSAMTYQAQSSTPKVKVEKPAAEPSDKEVTQASSDRPDNNTIVVKDPEEAQSGKQKDSRKEEGQSPNGQDAVNEMMDKMAQDVGHNAEAKFDVHEDTKRVMIKIVDKDSQEVLKEYPPEKTLDMIAKVWELAGLFVDEKR